MGRKVRIVRFKYESPVYQVEGYMIEDTATLEVLRQDFQNRDFQSREQAEEYAKNQGWEVVA